MMRRPVRRLVMRPGARARLRMGLVRRARRLMVMLARPVGLARRPVSVMMRRPGMGFSLFQEIVEILFLAAVVDQDDIGEAVLQQAVDDTVQLLVRVQGRQNYGDLGKIGHNKYLFQYDSCSGHYILILVYHISLDFANCFRKKALKKAEKSRIHPAEDGAWAGVKLDGARPVW